MSDRLPATLNRHRLDVQAATPKVARFRVTQGPHLGPLVPLVKHDLILTQQETAMSLPSYTVWFRGKPACPCLAEWIPAYEAELQRRGLLAGALPIYQLIGNASASADTHSLGGAFDISDPHPSQQDVWVARQMGADATWLRTSPPFTTAHIHGVLRGCDHNGPARYQITEVDAGGDGLVGSAPDPGPRPLSYRTWREGIAWAKKQGDDMFEDADRKKLEDVHKWLDANGVIRTKLNRGNELLRTLRKKGNATQRDLDKLAEAFGTDE